MFSKHRIFFFVSFINFVSSFKEGPPIEQHPDICESLFPTGHGFSAKTTAAPFKFTFWPTCANDLTTTFNVSLVSINNVTHFEGLFVQARFTDGVDNNKTYGMFGTNDDPQLQGLKCHNSDTPDSFNSLGQSVGKRYYKKTFTWTTPPSGINGTMQLVATVVHEKDEFWLDVRSPVLRNCEKMNKGETNYPPFSRLFTAFLTVFLIAIL